MRQETKFNLDHSKEMISTKGLRELRLGGSEEEIPMALLSSPLLIF